ncbi:MAG: WYL domain-containing transcriptional regulator [Firmicutes bacterium]|nr:WYL domain-containing transcriptional regulator [Bacillota bacterium]
MKNSIKQVERQLYILTLLSLCQEGLTIKELHARLQRDGIAVSTRTVRRDLNNLSMAKFPIYEEKKGKDTRYFLRKLELKAVPFSIGELIGLYFLKELLSPVSSLPVIQDAYNIISKSIKGLPRLDRKFILNLKDQLKIDHLLMDPEEEIPGKILKILGQAIADGRVIKARYYSFHSDAVSERYIEPYHIIMKNRHYYLIGYCRERCEMRDFRISRFQDLALTEEYFEKAKNFSYADYIKHSWHILKNKEVFEMKVKFTPQKARFVKEYYSHQADRLKECADGSLLFYRRVAGLEEVIPWVLSFGGEVEVLSPPELKETVLKHLQRMQATYFSLE